jgi:superfamily II RNA helicase
MTVMLDPRDRPQDPDTLLEQFLDYATARGLELYPAQEEAILELFAGNHVILNTPTGSGKSLVAAALHFLSAATGRKSVYTCPIKALVNEKFLALCREFGPEQVGMMTGDASVNRAAPILCCTAEILANIALRDGGEAAVDDVIMDEFHYYGDRDRGVAWQIPLLTLPRARFLLMSATLGDTSFLAKDLTERTKRPCVTVANADRPVPLQFNYLSTTFTEALEALQAQGQVPVYIVHFSQRAASETAQSLLSLNFCTKAEKEQIRQELVDVRFSSPFGKEMRKFMLHGVGLHHAGLLPKYRLLVEKLVQQGLLKAICGTDTLGVGVNVPIRTVLFTQLCKYDGSKTRILDARDFHQISGRAGRRGFDTVGYVACLDPAHVVENRRNEEKISADPKKKKKIVKRKPPERGYVHWDDQTFVRLQGATPEVLTSQFAVSHGMLLSVLSREDDGCAAMRQLIQDCHQAEAAKVAMRHQAWEMFRALVGRNIIAIHPPGSVRKLQVNVELQDDFSLNQSLSLYCLDTLGLLNITAPEFVFKLLSVVESILENPEVILARQLDKLKGEKIAEMKLAGI